MRQTRPLPDTHPEFSVIEWPTFHEYRVENWRLARDGSGRIIRGAVAWSWLDLCLPLFTSLLWPRLQGNSTALALVGAVLSIFAWSRCSQVLYESVLVFPTLGIQLETHRGHPWLGSLSVSRQFIHVSCLEDFVIHEGLRRWNVRYFLAAIKRSSNSPVSFCVAFENILPYFPALLQVYSRVQNSMFPREPETR
ncbi:hypothetical protein M404DRAFT_998944 [Pisolithus tinctorius Marx 270]|uniref:Phosphatidylinositol N-acetylglucosaminyltransferase subunit H conserved domain-containing protein n=1 Tax=Pisolithus tinctorius Marx 270 TaxID=870435 RepID=A0A0C3NTE4_PISTI|nr:hypothetical protein M404DRAFT_1000674 [Pisolithus tinctorius Marx 270]KIO06318.1 hypothetical protein M404DRAFT_998944 [Pisolithus tinctorius Marx 270]